jgi:ATP-dependent Lon protease
LHPLEVVVPESATLSLPVLPLTNGVVLPQMVLTIAAESPEARLAADAAGDGGRLLLLPRIDGQYATVGVIATIESRGTLPSGVPALVVRATERARVRNAVVGDTQALWLVADPVPTPEPSDEARQLGRELRATFRVLFERIGGRRLVEVLAGLDDPGALADAAGWWPELSSERKLELLETIDVADRVRLVLGWAKDALAELELSEQIRSDVTEGMERSQREFLLRQQLAAIRKELGEDAGDDPAAGYRARLEERTLPEAVRAAVERELDRLERTGPQAAEHGWIETWLDTVFDLPWETSTTDDLDLVHAREVLDADHFGLSDIKDRLVEELAVRKLRARRAASRAAEETAASSGEPDEAQKEAQKVEPPVTAEGRRRPTILALVGPPGVGKTSLGESIARALGRRFVRVALGGVRDEAEIRGHRRTYVGARPGRIVRALTEAGSMNPVFLLDELDKVGADWRGDPAAALLEVLDPAQNHRFRDHYLELDLDLSDVVFVATANVLETIPPALLDRLEVITVDGYTDEEKVAIARGHLLPRQLESAGLTAHDATVTDDALRRIIGEHTREAGVRGLERALGKALRKVGAKVATGEVESVTVDADQVPELLGRAKVRHDRAEHAGRPGVVSGLAVTGAGGDVLAVEAAALPLEPGGVPSLTVTGQLGDVMKESARIALSYVEGHASELGLDPADVAHRFHIHFPAGAIPKDGPSAGVTMTTALVSLLSGRAVRPEVGMTGEVTLSGRVLPIGGVKQKVLAAHRAGLTEVVLPADNDADLDDVPESVREAMTFHTLGEVADVVALALEPAAAPAAVPA